jgi:hypothetical protein
MFCKCPFLSQSRPWKRRVSLVGGGMVAAAFGDVWVAGVFEGRDDGSAMVARLAGPLPVRLVEVSLLSPDLGLAVRSSYHGHPLGAHVYRPADQVPGR